MKPLRCSIASVLSVVFIALIQAPPAEAVSSRNWRLRDRADFDKAERTTISMTEDGALSLAPPLSLLYEAEQPFLWALAQDEQGNIYAAGGNDGVIYRIDKSGAGSEFFRTAEPEVHSLAVDRKGRLYAGTAPGGRIYRIEPNGEDASTFETEEEYVWDMVFDDDGVLYAATGTEGRIIRIDSAGKGDLFFDSAETHIRTLVRDRDGTLLAGSAGHGLIFRIAPDGTAFVVYDTPFDEVVTLAAAADGTIYAATVSGSGRGRPQPPPAPPQKGGAEGGPDSDDDDEPARAAGDAPPAAQQAREPRVRVTTEGQVLAISADGYGRAIWEGKDEVVLSMVVSDGDRLLMGSSRDGLIYARDPAREEIGIIAEAPSSQVTALARRAGKSKAEEEILIAGSNLGTVALLSPGHAPSGSVESPPLDAMSFATWGRISWKADLPRGTAVTFQGRSGNTEDPDRTWSEWGEELTDPGSAVLDLPAARFVQWRAILETDDPGTTPVLHEVTVSFLQRNLPPIIAEVGIHRSGEGRPQGVAAKSGRGRLQNPAARSNRDAGRAATGGEPEGKEPAVRFIAWNATDPNGDDLSYRVEFRGADEKTWKLLQDEVEESFLRLDTTAMPDGTYLVRVTASDAPSNAPEQVLGAARISGHFDVDNTPPRVEGLKTELNSPSVRLQFTVSDSFSTVHRTAYAVDAGDWVEAQPVDGMNDDLVESYTLNVEGLSPGEHSIVVRAMDAAGNVGAGKAIVEIP